MQFFSLLAPAGLVTGHSLLETYKSLLSVLNEVGGGGERAERVIRAVGEGLIRVSVIGTFECDKLIHAILPVWKGAV